MSEIIQINERVRRRSAHEVGRIAVLVEERYLAQAQPRGLIEALHRQGRPVSVIIPEKRWWGANDDNWLSGVSLVVARGRSVSLLCMLDMAERRGVPTINSRAAIASVHNKAEMAVALASARIATPATFIGSPQELAGSINRGIYPLIIKPVFGDNGCGVQVVLSMNDLQALPETTVLAQHFVAGDDGCDLKLYCIGDEVWGVRKSCAVEAIRELLPTGMVCPGEEVAITRDLLEVARRCRRLFSLDLCGIDCIQTVRGTVVIEVNDFPNYSAVPAASERLAAHVCSQVRECRA